jgi:antirestriction protein ArdC
MRDLYSEVSARFVAELERGAAPWVKRWSATAGHNVPQNAVSGRPYSGCNVILLWLARNRGWATPRFLTCKQAIDAGGNVRRGGRHSATSRAAVLSTSGTTRGATRRRHPRREVHKNNTAASDAKARRAAKRVGLRARQSRFQIGTSNNHGKFMLIDRRRLAKMRDITRRAR